MIQYQNSMLPKLLAKENISIQHGNYQTAWFDIKNRTLGLPLWKDMSKDEYDLLVGHEVGHALETPYEGWHDSTEKLEGCPRSYINVIEDARIERKIQSRYPGLVGCFSRGYKKLFDKGFFGDISQYDWNEIKLIDKINLKAKIGPLLDVPFTDEEKVFFDRAITTDTFEDVVELVRDILAYTKENEPELLNTPEQEEAQEEGTQEETNSEVEATDEELEELFGESPKVSDKDAEDGEEEEVSSSGGNEEVTSEDDTESTDEASPTPEYDEDTSITDEMFRSKEGELVDTDESGKQPLVIANFDKTLAKHAIIDFNELMDQRAKTVSESKYYMDMMEKWNNPKWGFKKYIKDTKKSVQVMVREFEMRKAAYQYSRATTAKTGAIDVNKLWSYKTNDDIFLKQTKLADAKDHGMVMLIDYSGSMSSSMKYVMDQVIHTVLFCKAVSIPFEVYGFTSTNEKFDAIWHRDNPLHVPAGHIDLDGVCVTQLIHSGQKKADFEAALQWLYARTKSQYWDDTPKGRAEDWGSTPLIQALMVCDTVLKRFKSRYAVQKLNFVTFTDGDANRIQCHGHFDAKSELTQTNREIKINVGGVWAESQDNRPKNITKAVLGALKKKHNTTNIGFFMADDNSEWKYRLNAVSWEPGVTEMNSEKARKIYNKEYRKNKCVNIQNIFGYDEYYMVKGGKNLDTSDDEFEVENDATDKAIGNAFKKYSQSKKTNKVLMTKFGKAVA